MARCLRIRALWLGGLAAGLTTAVALAVAHPSHDVAWIVYLAEQILAGKKLYVDLIEVNPPLIVVLTAVPTWFASLSHLPPLEVFFVATGAVLLLSAWCTATLLLRYSALFADRLATAAVIAVVLALLPRAEFGQRENLIAAAVLPYLATLALRLRGNPPGSGQAAAAGVAAGIGFAIKPHYFIAFVLLEGLARLRGLRSFRPETAAVVAVAIAYLLAIAAWFPAYLTETLAFAINYYLGAAAVPLASLVSGRYFLVIGIVGLVLASACGRRSGHDPLLLVLAVFGWCAALIYVVQLKGWAYHAMPCYIAFGLALLYSLAIRQPVQAASWLSARNARLVILAFLGCLEALLLVKHAGFALEPQRTSRYELADAIRRDGVRSLLVLSDQLEPAWPVVNETGVRWASRFCSMWALAEERAQGARGDAASGPILTWVVDDFLATRPEMVAVDEHASVDYLATLLSAAAFAREWASYREKAPAAGLRIFERRGSGYSGRSGEPQS
jgi:hypothetical protein